MKAFLGVTLLAIGLGVGLPIASNAQSSQFFREGRQMPLNRHYHGSAVLGNYLYVFGGQSQDETSVIFSRIAENGDLGEWRRTTPLPQPRYYIANASIALNDFVYIVGGGSSPLGGRSYNNVIYARPNPDGTLSNWLTSTPFAQDGLSNAAAVATPSHIHVIGGMFNNKPTRNVYSIRVNPNGTLEERWNNGPTLPIDIWYHSAVATGGRVFVWGGNSDSGRNSTYAEVYSSSIKADGSLSEWKREAQSLPQPFYAASQAVAGPYLLSFGPRYKGGQEANDVWYSFATPDGITPWQRQTTSMASKIFHASATDYRRGYVYITGGRAARDPVVAISNVTVFTLSPEVTAQAYRNWQQNIGGASTSVTIAGQQSGDGRVVGTDELGEGAVPGFRSIAGARQAARSSRQPMVLYFTNSRATPCVQQNEILKAPAFNALTSSASFGWVDTGDYPQMAQQMGVYMLPTWIVYDTNSTEKMRRTGVLQVSDIEALLR